MSNFLVDAIGNIERDYDPDIKESAKTEKLKFTEPKLSDEVRYDTNIPYDQIGKIDSYIDKYESETLKVSDSLSFSEYDEKNKGKEVVSVTEGMSKHATEVYEKLKMEHKELSYSEKDKTLFIENVKKDFIEENQLEKLPDLDEKLGKIYDNIVNNIEKLPPEYGISMNKAITEYKEMLNMQTGQDPEAIKNILTMHYNSLLKQLREEKILTGPELEALQALDNEAIKYYDKKYVEDDKGEVEKTQFKANEPKEEFITTELNANDQKVKTKPTPPREGFTLSEDSLVADGSGRNTKFNAAKVEALGSEKTGISEKLGMDVDTASYDSVAEDRVMNYSGDKEKTVFDPEVKDTNAYSELTHKHENNDKYQVINNGTETYAESTTFNPTVESTEAYNELTHKNDNNDGYKTIQVDGRNTTYAEAAIDRSETRSNNIYMEYISMRGGIPENYGDHQDTFWDYYARLDFSSTTSLITSGASELAKLRYGTDQEMAEKYENWTKTVLERTGVDVMINESLPGKLLGEAAFYADLAAKIIQHKDKLTFENYLFATTYLYYLTPILPDIGSSGYNRTGKDWRILGYADDAGGLGNKVATVAKNIGKSFLNTVTAGTIRWESNEENVGASKFIREVYDDDKVGSNPSVDTDRVNVSRIRKLDFTESNEKDSKGNDRIDTTYIRDGNNPFTDDYGNKADNSLFKDNFILKKTSSIVPGVLNNNLATQDSSGVITKDSDNAEIHVSEISDEILFKGRSVIKAAENNGFMLNNQFNWDIKIEPLFDIDDYESDDLISSYCRYNKKYNVPDLADFMGPNWLPVTDFNINFTSNAVNQVQIGTGINIPAFNKVEFPSTLSLSIYESNALAIKQWLYEYQMAIYGVKSGGYIKRPYQFAASKCTIYLWSVAPISKDSKLFNALTPTKKSDKYYERGNEPGILRRYILYIVPINFDLQINGAGAPSLESRNLNFTIVGSERGYSLNGVSTIMDPNTLTTFTELGNTAGKIKNMTGFTK